MSKLSELLDKMSADQETDWAAKIGKPAYETIAEMVAAMQCDFDRLDELRDERDDWDAEENDGKAWADANPDDAQELKDLESDAGDCKEPEDARQRIEEDALSVEVRSGWCASKAEMEPEEFCILVTTGGPAVRILGDLDRGEPSRAWLEVKDWGKPWTEYYAGTGSMEVLLAYASCFYFGE